ncbi:DUF3782 domain-containing protein [Methylothermus subterraneus]
MTNAELIELLRKELPRLLAEDSAVRAQILALVQTYAAGKQETDQRFWEMLAEFRREREEWNRRFEEQRAEDARKWDEWNRKWEQERAEEAKKWEEQQRKWQEWSQRWEQERIEDAKKWQEWNQKWEQERAEEAKKWEENSRRFEEVHQEILAVADRLGRQMQALGARWGISSERAFRDALAGILSKTFKVEVLHVIEFDASGEVFGRPDQIELDVIIRNGALILCEIKSSLDKGDVYLFERKARFYEKLHQRRADRLIAISPYATSRAREVAARLGIEVYSDAVDVPPS